MLDFMFFLKTVLVTILIALALQSKVGKLTLEDHAHQFIQTSTIMEPIHQVAQNGAILVKRGLKWVSTQVSQQLSRHGKGSVVAADRLESFGFQRSQQYQNSKKQKSENTESSEEQ